MLSPGERVTAARPNPNLAGPPFDARIRVLQDPAAEIEARQIAFEGIVAQYGNEMKKAANHGCRSKEDAEDVLQEGYLEAWRKLGNDFESKSPKALPGWLTKTVRYKTMHAVDKKSRRKETALEDPNGDEGGVIDRTPSPEPEIPDTLIAKEGLEEMLAVLRPSLSGRSLRRLFQNALALSNIEIAETEGLTEGNVRVQLHRARHKAKTLKPTA